MNPNIQHLSELTSKHSPAILTGAAIAGVIATSVLAIKATPAAHDALEEYRDTLEVDEKPNIWDEVKIGWRFYIPTGIVGLTTIAAIVFVNRIDAKRLAAAVGAYSIAQESLKTYKDNVVEVLGEKEHQKVSDHIAERKIKEAVSPESVVVVGKGEQLCYDTLSGRYFKSEMETLRRVQNDLNQELLNGTWLSLNEFYSAVGLRGTKMGDDLGWVPDNMLELKFSAQIAENGEPCIVVDYLTEPKFDYYRSI